MFKVGLCLIGLGFAQLTWAAPTRVLMTAFGEFGGEKDNASRSMMLAFAKTLEGQKSVPEFELKTAVLPVVYGKAEAQLQNEIESFKPDLVISLGQAPGVAFRVETTAYNLDDSRAPDNLGVVRLKKPIVPGGVATYGSALPTEEIRASISTAGFSTVLSQDPGRYLCNHLFYQLMKMSQVGIKRRRFVAGFVHVPSRPADSKMSYDEWGLKHVPAIQAVFKASMSKVREKRG